MTTPAPANGEPYRLPPTGGPRRELLVGIFSGLGLSAVVCAACFLFPIALTVFGLLQIAWMVPLGGYFNGKGRAQAAKGVWIAMALVFLLSGACWGAMMFNLSNMH